LSGVARGAGVSEIGVDKKLIIAKREGMIRLEPGVL